MHDAPGTGAAGTGPMTAVDFRRPSGFSREAVRGLAALHDLFTRRVVTGWGTQLRSVVQVEELGVEQAAYEEYVQSMPNPSALAIFDIPGLAAPVIVECNTQLALTLVDRVLGGGGTTVPGAARRLTDVESSLFGHLLVHVAHGLREALAGITDAEPQLRSIEYNPALLQVAAPTDRVALLTYRVGMIQGVRAEGLLTVCYPSAAATPVLEALTNRETGRDADTDVEAPVDPRIAASLQDTAVDLRVGLTATPVRAADLGRLQPGDVIRLDHRVDQPALLRVAGTEVARGHAGRRGQRLAVQLTTGVRTREPLASTGWGAAPTPAASPTPAAPLTPDLDPTPAGEHP